MTERDRRFTEKDRDRMYSFLAGYNVAQEKYAPLSDSQGDERKRKENVLMHTFFHDISPENMATSDIKLAAHELVHLFYEWRFTTAARYKTNPNHHVIVKELTLNKLKGFTDKKAMNSANRQLSLDLLSKEYVEAGKSTLKWMNLGRLLHWAIAAEKSQIKLSSRM